MGPKQLVENYTFDKGNKKTKRGIFFIYFSSLKKKKSYSTTYILLPLTIYNLPTYYILQPTYLFHTSYLLPIKI
jgi:hypothetical protein